MEIRCTSEAVRQSANFEITTRFGVIICFSNCLVVLLALKKLRTCTRRIHFVTVEERMRSGNEMI